MHAVDKEDARNIAVFWTLLLGATIGLVALAYWITTTLTLPPTTTDNVRPFLLCAGLVVLSIGTYAVWPDRWNVIAHTQVAFCLVAYVIPIYSLHELDTFRGATLDLYYKIITVGAVLYMVGIVFGAVLVQPGHIAKIRDMATFDKAPILERRTSTVGWLALAGVLGAFAIMGFIPAFASDPLLAKFFRGPYAAPYARAAYLYRFANAAVTAILPIVTAFAWRNRKGTIAWRLLLVGSVGVLALELTRQIAVSGILIVLGVSFAIKGHRTFRYILILIGVYFLGAISYSILDSLGLGGFTANTPTTSTTGTLAKAASGAPDVSDQVRFLTGYILHPLPAHGRTFFGGLIPKHYPWNSSVYSLTVANPGQQLSQIQSGGLRLPAPIWGYANFGWSGVVWVSALAGVINGYLARLFRHLTPSGSLVVSTAWITLYAALLGVFPVFFRLQYLTVLQLILVAWILLRKPSGPRTAPTDIYQTSTTIDRIRAKQTL